MKCCRTVRARVRGQGRAAPVTATSCPLTLFPKAMLPPPQSPPCLFQPGIQVPPSHRDSEIFLFVCFNSEEHLLCVKHPFILPLIPCLSVCSSGSASCSMDPDKGKEAGQVTEVCRASSVPGIGSYNLHESSQPSCETGFITPIFQARKLRLREVK